MHFVNNQWTIVINFHKEFVVWMHIDSFQRQMDRGVIYRPSNFWETRLCLSLHVCSLIKQFNNIQWAHWPRPEILAWNPMHFVNNQWTIVVNFHQDLVVRMHSDSFQRQMDRGLIYRSNNFWETRLCLSLHVCSLIIRFNNIQWAHWLRPEILA